ncbi:MAG TPA: hypothetical protein PLL20_19365 [Phycisphaerae bacterium]|nr:hypothetical protein [Phycisphaerae bacterium]
MTPRQIVHVRTEARCDCERLGSCVTLTLACGHVKRMKASRAPIGKTHCPQCEQQRQAKGLASDDST